MTSGVRGIAAIATALALLAGLPRLSAAQSWVVDLSAGRVSDQTIARAAPSSGASLFVRRDGAVWGYAGGGAALDSSGVPWAAGGAGARVLHPLGTLAIGADLAARGYLYGARAEDAGGNGITLEAMPLLAGARGPLRAELRAGVLASSATADSGTRTLFASDARVQTQAGELSLGGEARWWQAPDGGYPYLGVSARREGRVSVWADAGAWLSDRVDRPAWSAGASLAVRRGTELYLSAAQETNDPLYQLAPRRSWSLGVTHRLGAPAALPRLPAPARPAPGGVLFRLPLSASPTAPAVGGDFNQWRAVPMQREGDAWVARVPLAAGAYHYAFRHGDGAWFVPPGTPGRGDDGFGGVSALLLVP
jgi:hypothetical protein